MAQSAAVATGDLATAAQYNNLRNDVISTTLGHVHDGTNGRGSLEFILTVAGRPLLLENSTNAVSNEILLLRGNNSTRADNDEIRQGYYMDDDGGNSVEVVRFTQAFLDVSAGSKDSRPELQYYTANTVRELVFPAITANDTVVVLALAQTLTNKTLTGPTLGGTIAGTPTWTSSQAITVSTAAQTSITSLGTLTALAIDNVSINGNTITTTSSNLSIDALAGQAIRLNDAQADVDVVIESDAADNLMHWDAGLGAISIGGAANANRSLWVQGAFTGSSNSYAVNIGRSLTGPSGGGQIIQLLVNGSAAGVSGQTHSIIASVSISEPAITANSATITEAATLYIESAPTEGSTNYAFHVDAGASRLDGSLWVESSPTEGTSGEQLTSGGAGTIMTWSAAGSMARFKRIYGALTPQEAYRRILDVPTIPLWTYKDQKGMVNTGDFETEYSGVLADDAPWAMHHEGQIFDPASAFGHTVGAVQAIQREIAGLKSQLKSLRGV